MKHLSLLCIFCLSLILCSNSFGQNSFIVTSPDTVYINDTVFNNSTFEKVIGIKNNSANSYTVDWEVISNTGSRSWIYSVCDLANCYTAVYHERSFFFGADSAGTMKVTVEPMCIAGTGEMQIHLWIDGDSVGSSKSQILTWIYNIDTASACNLASGITSVDQNTDIRIYPNPTSSNLQVNFIKPESGSGIELYDLNGRLLYFTKDVVVINNVPLQFLSTGTYLLKVLTPSGVITKKVEKI